MTTIGHPIGPPTPAPVRVAVVGSGPFGALHAAAFQRNPDCTLVAIVNHDLDRARALADRIGVPGAYATVQELLDAEAVAGISVATANEHHVAPTLIALDAGVSVLLEKPVAPTPEAATALLEAEARSLGFVLPAHLLRFAAPYQELKHSLDSGAVGRAVTLSFRRHRGLDHDGRFSETHPALMTMVHDIDLALWLAPGRPTAIRAREFRVPGRHQPMAVWAEVDTDTGTTWSFQTSWSVETAPGTPGIPDALEILGERGALSLRLDSRVWAHSPEPALLDDALTPAAAHGALDEEIRHFVSALRRGSTPSQVTLAEAVSGLDLAWGIIRAAQAAEGTQ